MARTLSQPHNNIESDAVLKQRQLIAALRDPQHYPHPAKVVQLIETHISWVLLAGRFAYKIKKAIDLGFLDATKLEARHEFCREELRLNRRLAPSLYLDVVPIGGTHSHPELDTHPAIEYAVKMRRFAAAKTFDRLLVRGKITVSHMDALATALARFHCGLPATTGNSSTDFAANVHAALTQNFSQLSELLANDVVIGRVSTRQLPVGLKPDLQPNIFAALQQTSENAFENCKALIEQRHAQGYVRKCHGDLHLGNIALIEDEPTPFDGIDFNPVLRRIDVMDEVAFLFTDLLHHRQAKLAYRFLNTYLEITGDYAGVALLDFYCAYRAPVRAKVNAIRAHQNGIPQRSRLKAMTACREYLSLASECLMQRQPKLIITHGLPGSGKSTFAQLALQRLEAIRLRSDVERKRLFGLTALENSHAGQDIYSTEATQRTYAHLRTTAHTLLCAGHTVIVDAAFLKREEREMFRNLANEMHAPFAIASMHADETTLRTRIRQRQARADDVSEADLAVLEKLQAAQEILSPQEIHLTAIFASQNDTDPAWQKLEELLHISSARR